MASAWWAKYPGRRLDVTHADMQLQCELGVNGSILD